MYRMLKDWVKLVIGRWLQSRSKKKFLETLRVVFGCSEVMLDMCSDSYTRKQVFGGVVHVAKAHKTFYESRPSAVKATEAYMSSIIGRKHCVGIAHDMDIYTVSRKLHEEQSSGGSSVDEPDPAADQAQRVHVANWIDFSLPHATQHKRAVDANFVDITVDLRCNVKCPPTQHNLSFLGTSSVLTKSRPRTDRALKIKTCRDDKNLCVYIHHPRKQCCESAVLQRVKIHKALLERLSTNNLWPASIPFWDRTQGRSHYSISAFVQASWTNARYCRSSICYCCSRSQLPSW